MVWWEEEGEEMNPVKRILGDRWSMNEEDLVETTVSKKRKCNICNVNDAEYDGKTVRGPWAYMCEGCFDEYGIGLGTGKGQKLKLR